MKSKFFLLVIIVLLICIGGIFYIHKDDSSDDNLQKNNNEVMDSNSRNENINNDSDKGNNDNSYNGNSNSNGNNNNNDNNNSDSNSNINNNSNKNNNSNNSDNPTLNISNANFQGRVLKKSNSTIIANAITVNNVDGGQEAIVNLDVTENDKSNVNIQFDNNTKVYYCIINSSNYSTTFKETDISNVKIDSSIYAWGKYENTYNFKADYIAIVQVK